MATINPHYDAEAHENRLDRMEQEREYNAGELMKDEAFIDQVFADGFPTETMARIAQHVQRLKATQHSGMCDGPYLAIGRLICDHIAECAWEEAKKK